MILYNEYNYKKSDKTDKEIMAIIENTNKKIHFGAKLYEDYTKMIQGKNHIYQGISTTTIPIQITHRSTLLICCGIKKH